MKGLISCSVACRFYDIPTGKCRLKCEEKADPNADFYDDCPLPDVTEVKHGKWLTKPLDNFRKFENTCSVCGWSFVENYDGYVSESDCDFCPHCGAKMDGGENDGK